MWRNVIKTPGRLQNLLSTAVGHGALGTAVRCESASQHLRGSRNQAVAGDSFTSQPLMTMRMIVSAAAS